MKDPLQTVTIRPLQHQVTGYIKAQLHKYISVGRGLLDREEPTREMGLSDNTNRNKPPEQN
jgi:hypothetical protein